MEATQLIALLKADGYTLNTDDYGPESIVFEKEEGTACIEDGTLTLCANPNVPGTVSGMPRESCYMSYNIADCTAENGKLILPAPCEILFV